MAEAAFRLELTNMNAQLTQSQQHVATMSQTIDNLNGQISAMRADFDLALQGVRNAIPAPGLGATKPMQLIDMKNFQPGQFGGKTPSISSRGERK